MNTVDINRITLHILNLIIRDGTDLRAYIMDSAHESFVKIGNATPRCVCGHAVENEPVVKCYTCSNDMCSILCMKCFDESKHKGHNYKCTLGSGMCDCGYAQTINPSGFCSRHEGNQTNRDPLVTCNDKYNADNILAVLLFCVRQFYYYFKKQASDPKYAEYSFIFVKLLIEILTVPIDIIRRAFSYVLIFTKEGPFTIDDLKIKSPFSYIPVYTDVFQLIRQFRASQPTGIMETVPLGLFLMVLNNIGIEHQLIMRVQHLLIELQISEPVFRIFVAYAYYMKNLCTIIGVVQRPVF